MSRPAIKPRAEDFRSDITASAHLTLDRIPSAVRGERIPPVRCAFKESPLIGGGRTGLRRVTVRCSPVGRPSAGVSLV